MENNSGGIKIYFSGSIRGGREDALIYRDLISFLKKFGTVLTEHIGDPGLIDERHIPPCKIHDRDMEWLLAADMVIAEVTTPSLGVGYELGRAVALGKPVLCLYRRQEGKMLSGMISGSPGIVTVVYKDLDEARIWVEGFVKSASTS
jgi:hypothetical protein